jgi:hypothetical protein
MASKGLHFIGDSAYSIKSFILTPYDNAAHGSPEDNYNCFHSSSWIVVDIRNGFMPHIMGHKLSHIYAREVG